MLRNLILTALVAAAFLGGYHLGRAPDSPDLIGGARRAGTQVVEVGKAIAAFIEEVAEGAGFSAERPPPEDRDEDDLAAAKR